MFYMVIFKNKKMSNQAGRTLGRRRLEESSASASGSKSERPVRAYLGEIYRFLFLFITVIIVTIVTIVVIIVIIVIIVMIVRINMSVTQAWSSQGRVSRALDKCSPSPGFN